MRWRITQRERHLGLLQIVGREALMGTPAGGVRGKGADLLNYQSTGETPQFEVHTGGNLTLKPEKSRNATPGIASSDRSQA